MREELHIPVPADAGTSTQWGKWMILEEPPRHLACDLPTGCECELGTLGQGERSNVLIPIRRLSTSQDGDRLDEELADLYRAHFDGPLGGLAQAFSTTVSEMSDNATTHGRSKVGVSYVAAQRYPKGRCVLVIGDLGIGIPAHVRRAYPHLTDDGDAIREATKEGVTGVTGTGGEHRGYGYQCVIDDLKNKWIARGELKVWSAKAASG